MRRFLALFFGVSAGLAATASAATFTVTNTNDSGVGSLRDSITQANTAVGADTIAFNVSGAGCSGGGVCTITPASQLPEVTGTTLIDGFSQPGSSANTNASGAINAAPKIVISGATVGVTASGLVVSGAGSTVRGLVINGGFAGGVRVTGADVSVRGCFIGTDATGTTASGNAQGVSGEGFSGVTGLLVGGPAPGDRNLIAGQTANHVSMNVIPNGKIEGNLLGTDKTGAATLGTFPNDAIIIYPDASGNSVLRNVIAGGSIEGINIGSGDAGGVVTIQGNSVGTDATGTVNFGNPTTGIRIFSSDVVVGGPDAGEGNVIAFNAGAGVFIYPQGGSSPVRCRIRGNSIHSNHQNPAFGEMLGIDLGENQSPLGGLTENDLGDADIGSNGLQNFPIITSAAANLAESPEGGTTTITGRLNSAPGTTYTLDFYSNSACVGRPQALLEGQTYLGSDQVTTDGSGNANINAVVPVAIAPGEKVTATATDPSGSTSEFSQRIVVASNPSSGNPAGVPGVVLTGFHFLPGAGVTVGGAAPPSVVVNDYNTITITTPNLLPGTLHDVSVTNTDGSAGTLPNGWIADFLDVPGNHPFYSYVTTLVRNAITAGVGNGSYGVAQDTKRQQMAVFLLKAKYGICYTPPPCTVPAFPDVPCSSNFAPWINQLVAENITGGCAGGNFCPGNPVNRQQMAVFLLKTFEGGSYSPPACTVASFGDVPCSHPFAVWIYELVARNITAGCGSGNYCPTTNANRGQMATFLTKSFNLQ